jgi:hypothetical protein
MENKEIIEMIKDAAFFGGNIQNENLEECRNFFDNVIEKQLTLTDVGWSEVFTKYGKPFTSGRDLWDWLKDNCKVVLKT